MKKKYFLSVSPFFIFNVHVQCSFSIPFNASIFIVIIVCCSLVCCRVLEFPSLFHSYANANHSQSQSQSMIEIICFDCSSWNVKLVGGDGSGSDSYCCFSVYVPLMNIIRHRHSMIFTTPLKFLIQSPCMLIFCTWWELQLRWAYLL